MSAPAYQSDNVGTMIPVAQAPSVAELAQRARAHERITLTEAGAGSVLVVSADDQLAVLDWETTFIAETIAGTQQRGPYLPNDLMAAVDDAAPATAEAFLAALESRAGDDIPAEQLRALWERMTCG